MIITGKPKLTDSGKNHLPDYSNVVVKDLREYGVEQAGSYKGGVEAYKGMLNKIRSGSILTEQDSVGLPGADTFHIRAVDLSKEPAGAIVDGLTDSDSRACRVRRGA